MAYVTPEYVMNDLLQEYKGNINTNDDLTKFKIAVRKIVYAFNKQASSQQIMQFQDIILNRMKQLGMISGTMLPN